MRIVFPFIIKGFINNAQKKFYGGNPNFDTQSKPPGKEGEVKVKNKTASKSDKKPERFGEYVDYEEIKE